MDTYMDLTQAATHAGVTVSYLKDQCRKGAGPRHFRPSPKKALFRRTDIDDWIRSWKLVDNTANLE